jgi:hypothetical protein
MTRLIRRAIGNCTYPKSGVSYSKDGFVSNQTLVLKIYFGGKRTTPQVAAKR